MNEIREIGKEFADDFNLLASHPLQSFQWGEFRKKCGLKVVRIGRFESGHLTETIQMTIHPVLRGINIAYIPKSRIPSSDMIEFLIGFAKKHGIIFLKLEPDVEKEKQVSFPKGYDIRQSPHPLFTKYSFILDLKPSEEQLLKSMSSKTRYNIKVARKHNIKVYENNSPEAFEKYLSLTAETVKRQGFFAHSRKYHELLWEALGGKMARLLLAEYVTNGKTHFLVTWIVFIFNKTLYYPYGASSTEFRNVMASNMMMWETILFGKKNNCTSFDMWGALSENPNPKDPWYGFHKFKQGYGGKLTEFVGSYDLVVNPFSYSLYNIAYRLRSVFLKLKSIGRKITGTEGL